MTSPLDAAGYPVQAPEPRDNGSYGPWPDDYISDYDQADFELDQRDES